MVRGGESILYSYIVFFMRPAEFPVTKLVRVSKATAQALSDYRFAKRYETESIAMREIFQAGMRALGIPIPAEEPNKRAVGERTQ